MLALGLVTPAEALAVSLAGKDALLFLGALLLFSVLLERSGFFEWAAVHAARFARGDGRALYRNVFLLGALITATLSLDTTAVILTPLVLAFVGRLRLPARPYIFACAFVANMASLALPISNLTNLIFADAFHLSFRHFAARMLLPQVVALALTYALFRRLFRAELPPRFDPGTLPSPASVIPHRGYFRFAGAVLALVLLGYFVALFLHLEPYVIGAAGSLALLLGGLAARRVDARVAREIPWSVFPFVLGLFIVVRGVQKLGFDAVAAAWLRGAGHAPPLDLLLPAGATALASNLINNLPAALLARGILEQSGAGEPAIYGALLGADLGPNVTIFGSLATLLVLSSARKRGEDLRGKDLLRVGLMVTPLVLVGACAALWLSFALVH